MWSIKNIIISHQINLSFGEPPGSQFTTFLRRAVIIRYRLVSGCCIKLEIIMKTYYSISDSYITITYILKYTSVTEIYERMNLEHTNKGRLFWLMMHMVLNTFKTNYMRFEAWGTKSYISNVDFHGDHVNRKSSKKWAGKWMKSAESNPFSVAESRYKKNYGERERLWKCNKNYEEILTRNTTCYTFRVWMDVTAIKRLRRKKFSILIVKRSKKMKNCTRFSNEFD